MTTIDRRTLLVGSAGLLVSACSGSGGGPAKPSGPNIVKPNAGTIVTPKDTLALRKRLNAATEARDVDQLIKIIDPDDFALDDVRKRWTRRFDNFARVPVEGEWYVGVPSGRTRNSAGGQVEYDGDLVFAHQIRGCDGQQVVETYSAEFRKKSEDAELELLHIGEPSEYYDPSFWDVAKIDVIETKHAYVGFRVADAKLAKANSARIEAGAKRAFAVMPRPKGVDKIFYAISWPAIDGKLYGGSSITDRDGYEYPHPFVDPEKLATGQKVPTKAAGLPAGTGRVLLKRHLFSRPDAADTAAHEGVHTLAEQWNAGSGKPTWVVEGLAMWGESGKSLLATDGARIRSFFGRFIPRALKGYDEFQESGNVYEMYVCAGAVFAYLEATGGRDAVYEVAEAFYSAADDRAAAAKALGRSEKELFTATRKWLGA